MRKVQVEKLLKADGLVNDYFFDGYPEAQSYIKMMVLRGLLDGNLLKYIFYKESYILNELGLLFGIKDLDEMEYEACEEIFGNFYEYYKEKKLQPPYILEKNVDAIANMLKLNSVERDLLLMIALFNEHEILESFGRGVKLNFNHALRVIAAMINHPYKDVKKALSPHGRLFESKLLRISRHSSQEFIDFFNLEISITKLFMEHSDVMDIFKEHFLKMPSSGLKMQDFDHIEEIVAMMQGLLRGRIAQKKGANILLYGKAGHGKTELIKLMAKELGSELFEISYMREDGEAIDGYKRLEALNLSTLVLSRSSFILFDEFDDIDDRDFFNRRFSYKAWLNRFLEKRTHIVFWVANSIDFLDEAMIRRFDLVLQMPEIPRKKRLHIAKKYLKGMDEAFIEQIAAQKSISPGVLSMLGESIEDSGFKDQETIIKLLNEKLKVQGYAPVVFKSDQDLLEYSLEYINSDYDIYTLTKLLKQTKRARLCFYGMPGTGKTEYAKFLAKELGCELIERRASDLLSMWVGGTEANIRAAFEEAKAENAILLIDEADSFLADRTLAQRSWEVTQVNEMLTQIENFEGIFIATTNFIDYLDKASLRRFDLKIEFRPLRAEQKEALFVKLCKECGFEVKKRDLVAKLEPLTLGDFATIKRGAKLMPFASSGDIYERLKEEVELKGDEAKVGLV